MKTMTKLKRAFVAIPPAILVGIIVGLETHPLLGFIACSFAYLATSAIANALVKRAPK
ncbi:MAG: hypothetical protein ACT6UW_22290 [Neoaquamicrobium sediminum]